MWTLPPGEHEDLRAPRQVGPRENNGGPAFATSGIETAGPRQKFLQARLRENVHRNDDPGSDLPHNVDHLFLVQREGAVDRNHDYVDRAELGEVDPGQGVVQMAEMRDAQIADLEDEDRVAVIPGPPELSDIGWNVADAHIAVIQMMAGDPAPRVPASEHVFDPGLDPVAVMRRMGIVHRGDVRRRRGPDRGVVVVDDPPPRRALDQKARMAEKGDRYRALGDAAGEAQWPEPAGDKPGARGLRRRRDQQGEHDRAGYLPNPLSRGVQSTTSTRNGPGVAMPSAKRSLNASIVVTRAPGTPIERASPTPSRSGWRSSSMSSALRPGLPAPTWATPPRRIAWLRLENGRVVTSSRSRA